MIRNEKGFSLIEVMLVIIAITLVTGVGFYVYSFSSNKDTNESTAKLEPAKPVKKDTESKEQFLEIKELGIKLETNEILSSAYYIKANNYFYFSTREIDSEPELKGCTANESSNALGIVALIDGKPGEDKDESAASDDVWSLEELDKPYFKKVGDTYYGFMKGNGICYDSEQTSERQEQLISDTLQEFIKQTSTFTKI